MKVITIETPQLGDRSYVLSDGVCALVVDPQRDIDRVVEILDQDHLTLLAVFETHLHNDYVSGGLELSQRFGCRYVVGGANEATYPCEDAPDGASWVVGEMVITAMKTPGHTVAHTSYLVKHGPESVICSGGSMLFGTVGRTDLVGGDFTDELTKSQYRSVRRLGDELTPETAVLPTHGFGSFCSSQSSSGATTSDIGIERETNIACITDSEEQFSKTLLSGLTAYPSYYSHMGLINRAGPGAPFRVEQPPQLGAEEVAERILRGQWVVDLRSRRDYGDSHLAGTLNFELGNSFSTYLGWVIPWGMPLSLLAEDADQIQAAIRDLSRIGIDRVDGYALISDLMDSPTHGESYQIVNFTHLAEREGEDLFVLDVRRKDEWEQGHLEGALHIPLQELHERSDELPNEEIWVHCASGFRASIAASMIHRSGRQPVYIDDSWTKAQGAGLGVVQ